MKQNILEPLVGFNLRKEVSGQVPYTSALEKIKIFERLFRRYVELKLASTFNILRKIVFMYIYRDSDDLDDSDDMDLKDGKANDDPYDRDSSDGNNY